jgi:hypothetical protein
MRTALRFFGLGLLSLLGLVVLVYVFKGVVGTVAVASAEHQARVDIEEALPVSQGTAERDRDAVRAALAQGDPELAAPTYSFTELTCRLASHDSGWIAQDYYQDCEVRTVDLYAVADGPEECDYDAELTGSQEVAVGSVTVHRAAADALDRAEPWERMCPDGVVAPSRFGAGKVLDGARPADLGASPGWVLVETATPVSETTLGCNPWGIVFCGEPVSEPTLPD